MAPSILATLKVIACVTVVTVAGLVLYIKFDDARTASRSKLARSKLRRTHSTYKYQSLGDASSYRIRLIELLPEAREHCYENSPFVVPEVRIRTCSLQEPDIPEYEAISYCWGDKESLCPVFGDGNSVLWVTSNLYCALLAFRHKDRARLLWADAICINQTDLDEKSWQVGQMSKVYRNAQRVLVWLGSGEESYQVLQEFVPRLVRAKPLVDDVGKDKTWITLSAEERKKCGLPSSLMGLIGPCHELISLTESEWFGRLWVVQEFVLARQVLVSFGDWSLDWADLETAYEFAERKGLFRACERTVDASRFECFVSSRRCWIDDPENSTLFYHLSMHRGAMVTDPRDRIFSLVGLAKDLHITVDYKKSVSEVFREAAQMELLDRKDLNVLALAGYPRSIGIPSWVPDWQAPMESLFLLGASAEGRVTSSTGFSESKVTPEDIGQKLTLSGFEVDSVTAVSTPVPPLPVKARWQVTYDGELKMIYKEWYDFCGVAHGKTYQPTGESLEDVFSQTIVSRAMKSRMPEHRANFKKYQRLINLAGGSRKLIPFPTSWLSFQVLFYIFNVIGEAALIIVTPKEGWYIDADFLRLLAFSRGRVMVKTRTGLFGMASGHTRTGDKIYFLRGGLTPFILRETSEKNEFLLIGQCYVHGYMDDKVWSPEKCLRPLSRSS